MSDDKRKDRRLGPDEIMEYRVSLENDPKAVDCYLRNISEQGMNIVLENNDLNLNIIKAGEVLVGGVEGISNDIYFDFKARPVWFEVREMSEQKFIIVGMKFEPGYILPRSFYEALNPI